MTPSSRRRVARVAWKRAVDLHDDTQALHLSLLPGASAGGQAGPTPSERAEALRLALRIARDADRLATRIMHLECDTRSKP